MRCAASAVLLLAFAGGCGRHGFDRVADDARGGDAPGLVDAANDAPAACINDLSNVGTASFEITFTLQAASTVKSALLFQRDPCAAPTYWDIYLDDVNRAVFELAAGGSLASSPSLVIVADGTPHTIRCTRIGASMSISVDGGTANMQSGPTFNFAALPQMEIAGGHACAGYAPLATGTVTNVCVRLL